ncbi:MAG: GTP cyclohydrolase FolE2 [Verrucomicrobiales bacterium]
MPNLKDTQNERDERQIPIDRVGVKSLRYPVEIRDKESRKQSTVATISLAVDLPHHYKGTHMSRFVEVMNAHGPSLSVSDISQIPLELIDRLDAQKAHIEFCFPYFIEKQAPVSGSPGRMDYEVTFEGEAMGEEIDFVVQVEVPVTTLCPCSKAISARGAHNQRGIVTFAVRFGSPIWIEDLVRLVEDCASCELYSLLKRPDEKFVTEEAFDNPVFVEDLVRGVAERANQHDQITWYRVAAENFESIHNHNAWAMIEKDKR